MRLLTVTHFYAAHGGGIERVAGHLCNAFARRGIETRWAASDRDGIPEAPVEAVPLRCRDPLERLTGLPMPLPGPASIHRLAREARQADAVIIHDALYVPSILAMLAAKRNGTRVVLVQHIAAIPFRSALLRLVMRLANRLVTRPMLHAADEVVFISDTVRKALLGDPPWREGHLVFNGVDTETFHIGAQTQAAKTPGPILLFVGRYVEKKGLSIIRSLASARPDIAVRMAGSGPLAPDDWKLPNVTDLGHLPPDGLAEQYRAADVLLLPSVGEGYPLVIQEAMACGLPVLCGAPTDRADPAATAWLRSVDIDLADPEGSAARCSEAVDSLLEAPIDRIALAAFAAQRYSWERMAEAIVALASDRKDESKQS